MRKKLMVADFPFQQSFIVIEPAIAIFYKISSTKSYQQQPYHHITISVFHKLVSPSLSQRMNEKDRYVNKCFYSSQYEHKYCTPHTHMYLYITVITKTPSLCCCPLLGHPFDNKMILFSCKKDNLIFELL